MVFGGCGLTVVVDFMSAVFIAFVVFVVVVGTETALVASIILPAKLVPPPPVPLSPQPPPAPPDPADDLAIGVATGVDKTAFARNRTAPYP